jgi:hypothetical protein
VLTKPKLVAQERFDLEDLNYFLSAIDADQKAHVKQYWAATAYILKGFTVTTGVGTATVALAGAALINPENTGAYSWWVGAAAATPLTASLTASSRNYLELEIYAEDGTPLTRAFWDQTANNGAGSEFNQSIDTVTDLKVRVNVNTSGFTGSANTLPLAILDTDSGNTVKLLLDRRNLFFRLALPTSFSNTFSWSSQSGIGSALVLTGGAGTYVAGETVTFSGGATATVLTGGTTSIVVTGISSTSLASGNTVVGGTSGASRTLSTLTETFTGADKSIGDLRGILSALMTEIKALKGTDQWFYPTIGSFPGMLRQMMSAVVPLTSGARWSWSAGVLSLTDTSGAPASTDNIGALRVFGNSFALNLRRQDGSAGTSTIAIADGSILWIELPSPLAARNYTGGVGSGSTNYRVTDRASFTVNDTNYWLAYREGSKLFIRNGIELESGESEEIGDSVSLTLLGNIGLASENASPAYTSDIRGTAAESIVARLGKATDALGDAQEDRSAQLRSTGVIAWSGSQVTFASNIILDILNTKNGTANAYTILAGNSPISLSDGDFAYVSITRGTNGNVSPVLNSVTPIPAQTQANKDIYVLFRRVGSDLFIPLHKQVITSGTSVKLGTAPGAAAARAYPTYFLSPAGNGDGTTFAAALAALPAAGGVILLMDDITLTSQVTITSNIKIMSRNRVASIIMGASGSLAITGDNVILEDVIVKSTQTGVVYIQVTGNNFVARGVQFDSTAASDSNVYLRLYGSRSVHENCVFKKTLNGALNIGVRYEAGSTDNSYYDPTGTT